MKLLIFAFLAIVSSAKDASKLIKTLGLPGLVKGRFGTDPTFELSSGEQTIDTPPLIWSETSSHMNFNFTVIKKPVNFSMNYKLLCEKPKGKTETILEGYIPLDVNNEGVTKQRCRQLFNHCKDAPKCRSFFVRVEVSMDEGHVDLTEFKFGSDVICLPKKDRPKRKSVNCDFKEGDCDFKNDACGFTEWKIKEDEESASLRKRDIRYFLRTRRSAYYNSGEPIALTKETTTDTCNYQSICVPCLQSSGFTVSSIAAGPERKRRTVSKGSSLYLDPSDSTSKIAMGVLNTPAVIYHTKNTFLKFSYVFSAEGMHQIVVGIVCTQTSTSSWIQLKENANFDVSNYQISAYAQSGRKCLNLHNYVAEDDCLEFAVQFVGAAAYSSLGITSVNFYDNLNSALCKSADN
eukprot:m.308769 g.308769  ORF g.308769 m.308769 type:complete len:405 (+) comp44751_c0_seq1:188-1402(+)